MWNTYLFCNVPPAASNGVISDPTQYTLGTIFAKYLVCMFVREGSGVGPAFVRGQVSSLVGARRVKLRGRARRQVIASRAMALSGTCCIRLRRRTRRGVVGFRVAPLVGACRIRLRRRAWMRRIRSGAVASNRTCLIGLRRRARRRFVGIRVAPLIGACRIRFRRRARGRLFGRRSAAEVAARGLRKKGNNV
jgi:hypothetical protein